MNVPDILRDIEIERAQISGWCCREKSEELAMAVLLLRPDTVVEVGVWFGKSAIPMAIACAFAHKGTVHCVDPWSAKESAIGYDEPNQKWWTAQDHSAVHQAFLDRVARLQLGDVVKTHRMPSSRYAPPFVIDILHLDGLHNLRAIADVEQFAPNVRCGGIVCMDDISWTTGGVAHVAQAADKLLQMGFIKLSHTKVDGPEAGEWAMFQRVKT